jgi:hypothetical protein
VRPDITSSSVPQICLKRLFDWRPRDAAGIVCDSGRRDNRDYLEGVVLAETGRKEFIDILIIEVSALLNQGFRQSRELERDPRE